MHNVQSKFIVETFNIFFTLINFLNSIKNHECGSYTISTDSLIELAECVLKTNIFEHDKSVLKQFRATAIGTKMTPAYAIIFMDHSKKIY